MGFSVIAAAMGSILCAQLSFATPHIFGRVPSNLTPRPQSPGEIQVELGPKLSENATIYFPGNGGFAEATERWNIYGQPNISVVVEVGTAEDVVKTVEYANRHNMPFLAVNRGHGSTDTLARLQNGIQISLEQLTSVRIAEDGNSALMGGGIFVQETIDRLAEHGKVAQTGSCACVGLIGAGLGAGTGRLQGFFGLVIDNIIDMNLVLWNGTQINVSEESYPDLFWGLRGAGHNFGIVTSFNYKIYNEPSPSWFYGNYFFTQDQLEPLFTEVNRQVAAGIPPEIGSMYVTMQWNDNISTTEPVLLVNFAYAGDRAAASTYLDPLLALGPVASDEGELPYPELASAMGTGVESELCTPGQQRMQFAVDAMEYNVTSNRQVFELFRDVSAAQPLYRSAAAIFQVYSVEGVRAIPAESAAYAHRDMRYSFVFIVAYEKNEALDQRTIEWGEQTRQIIYEGQGGIPYSVYVNYAFGNESIESVYGTEEWRLERLRALKQEWDPHGRFSYYMPIA